MLIMWNITIFHDEAFSPYFILATFVPTYLQLL